MSDAILFAIIAIQTVLLITFVAPVLYRWLKPAPQPEIPPAICLLEDRQHLNNAQLSAVMQNGRPLRLIKELRIGSPLHCYWRALDEIRGGASTPLSFTDDMLHLLRLTECGPLSRVDLYVADPSLVVDDRTPMLIWLVAGLAMNGIQAEVYLWTQESEAARAFAGPLSVVDATDGLSLVQSSTAV